MDVTCRVFSVKDKSLVAPALFKLALHVVSTLLSTPPPFFGVRGGGVALMNIKTRLPPPGAEAISFKLTQGANHDDETAAFLTRTINDFSH